MRENILAETYVEASTVGQIFENWKRKQLSRILFGVFVNLQNYLLSIGQTHFQKASCSSVSNYVFTQQIDLLGTLSFLECVIRFETEVR